MRPDDYPHLYYEVDARPSPGHYQDGSYSEDDFGELLGQCLWQWQGVFTYYDEKRNDIINIPHAFCRLHQGMIVTNACTGREYEIVKIIGQFRDEKYQDPPIKNTPESIRLRPRKWISDYHPDELTGGTVQIRPLDGIDSIDLIHDKGHFLSLPAPSRVNCRLIYSELASQSEGKGEEDRKSESDSGYEIEIVLATSGPNQSRESFGDTKQPKPRKYQRKGNNEPDRDVTTVHSIWSQTFDTNFEFNLKAPSAREVGWMAQWFQIFMWRYAPSLERIGFTNIMYDARFGGKISPLKKPEAGDMTKLRYTVRWERLFPSRTAKLRQVDTFVEPVREDGEPAEELNPELET